MADSLGAIGFFLAAFLAMELVAYATHRWVMHGPLWCLHESHHRPRAGRFERNDLFALFFAVPSIVLILLGSRGVPGLLWVGLGMSAYGLAYFLVHDVLVHRRLRLLGVPRWRYAKRVVQAHRLHHARAEREGCVSFGFLWAPPVERLRRQLRGLPG